MRFHQAECEYTENAVSSRIRDQFAEALNNPSPARRITILTDLAKSISRDVVEVDLPITHGQVSFRVVTDTQAKKIGTTQAAFYRLMRDAAISIASECSAIAASQNAEGKDGLNAVAKAEEHMRLAGLCDAVMNEGQQSSASVFAKSVHKAMERLSFSTGITQDYLKNQHLYHVLMA